MQPTKVIACLLVSILLTGCGLYVPKAHEAYEAKSNDTLFTNLILNNIKCELHRGAQITLAYLAKPPNPKADWLRGWGATVDIDVTAEEDGSFAAGVFWVPPPPFSLAFNVGASAKATRDEHIAYTYAFADLLAEGDIQGNCDNERGILIQSDLDIQDFIFKHVYLGFIPGTLPASQDVLYSTLKYGVTFVASYNASIGPAWTFKRLTVNPGGSLFGATRTKTVTLVITMAPSTRAALGVQAQLSPEGQAVRNAALIGQAVATFSQGRLR